MELKCLKLTFIYVSCLVMPVEFWNDGSPRYRASPMNMQLMSGIGPNFTSVLLLIAKYFHQILEEDAKYKKWEI